MALDYNSSPNMSLPVPISGYTTGPNWANYEVTAFGILDGHTHTPGSGVPITPGAININSTLSFNNQYASNVGFLGLTINSATLSNPPNISGLYSAGANGELWYNDGNGHQVQITSGGNVDTSGSGGITGLASPASATYVAGTIKFQATATTPANLDFGSAVFRNSSSLTNGLTVSAPTLGSSYSLTLPSIPAANNTLLTISTGGVIGSSLVVDNSTIVISSNTLEVPANGITGTQIAPSSVGYAQRTGLNFASSSINGQTVSNTNALTSITNTAVSLTTHGNPVMLLFESSNTGGFVEFVNNTVSPISFSVNFIVDSGSPSYVYTQVVPANTTVYQPTSAFSKIATGLSAASHSFVVAVQMSTGSPSAFINVSNCYLTVYELG